MLANSTRIAAKYCSVKCIKRASYIKKNPDTKIMGISKDFWKTETGIGYKWEKYIAKRIGATHMEFNRAGCDLEKDGELIDVKACNLWRRQYKRGVPVKKEQTGVWVFNRNKMKPCDTFYCVCLDNNKLVKVLKIPACEFGTRGITMGEKSKYNEYVIKL